MATMLAKARAKYPDDVRGSPYDEALLEVIERARTSGNIGKSDIGALMLWKRLNLSTRWSASLNNTPDTEVRRLTAAGIALARDTELPIGEAAGKARSALSALPGCRSGAAIASTILAAGAPERMAVYDKRAASALVSLGLGHPRGNYRSYMATVDELAAVLTHQHDRKWSIRDVDKALFMHAGIVES
ncbi:hypothetical protein GORHZ_110_00130 [Gordonia rhizosphera NBRC 16068]|uniref:Uncharacterized protein n=2 Tax=Gordonia rhizosphera TaxID=83341 RepID=K6WA15_9ACTN|nr:hypothetical protein GORHZ_110_00130 [Gordonia rhizosphera NBRC 16068]